MSSPRFACKQCDKTFARIDNLKRHVEGCAICTVCTVCTV